jgi:hypothetical protein
MKRRAASTLKSRRSQSCKARLRLPAISSEGFWSRRRLSFAIGVLQTKRKPIAYNVVAIVPCLIPDPGKSSPHQSRDAAQPRLGRGADSGSCPARSQHGVAPAVYEWTRRNVSLCGDQMNSHVLHPTQTSIVSLWCFLSGWSTAGLPATNDY